MLLKIHNIFTQNLTQRTPTLISKKFQVRTVMIVKKIKDIFFLHQSINSSTCDLERFRESFFSFFKIAVDFFRAVDVVEVDGSPELNELSL